MYWQDVEGGTANAVSGGRLPTVSLGATVFSHPVGQGLNANAQGYDRATPLDANGGAQGSGSADTNASNDLRLSATAKVTCLSCHAPHNSDSNSLTTDR